MITPARFTLLLLCSTLLPLFCVAQAEPETEQENQQQEIEKISQLIRSIHLISGSFEQQRKLPELNKPLISTGHFIYWKDQGIYWQTDTPYRQATTYSKEKTIIWKSPGIPAGEASNSSRDKHFRRILFSLFDFDLRQLEQKFETQWSIAAQQWQLDLIPSDTITRHAISSARLVGSDHIQQIEMTGSNNEKIVINFSQTQISNHSSHDMCVNKFGFSINTCNQLARPNPTP